ncbi:cGMP-gated cation channel alpha-1-like [Paramacrobiotus metropolitanus]|uniref:cGMP-gated cation channel alpha-1-like n=1 Tax=Paramacrobiotus metropolitanus TaxID=2943436 RepID=UPI0024457C06|nr:cGMP-gated cation channel alpha-1-like [Paramacrobiotus metropolitanus]
MARKVSFTVTPTVSTVAPTQAAGAVANGHGIPKVEPKIDLKDPMQIFWFFKFNPNWVINPESNGYYRWLFVVSLAVLYNVLFIFPRAVFWEFSEPEYWIYFTALDYVADLVYVIDLFVRMCCGYLAEERVMIREPRKLVKHWLRSVKGKLDVISILPTDIAFFWTGLRWPYSIIRVNRLLKYGRFTEFTRRTEGRVKAADIFRLSVLLLTWIGMMHWWACLYYFISEKVGLNSDGWVYPAEEVDWRKKDGTTNADDSLYRKYIWSFYWALMTLTMIGIIKQPELEWQFLFMFANFTLSVMLFSQILGNVSRTIINLSAHENEFRARMDAVKSYMAARNIGIELQQRIVNYFEYQWTNQQIMDERKVLTCLPNKLQADIAMKVHLETLKHVRIFQGVESGLLVDLVLKLKLQVFSPGDYICRKGDIGKELYIVKRGCLEVVSDAGDVVFATLGEGSVFGEISILNIVGIKSGNRRTANVRSIGYSDLFCLSKEDLWDALKEYPEGKSKMIELGKQLLIKDNLLDVEAAEREERRHNQFLDKLETVERDVDVLQTRFARLMAERGSAVQKMEKRIAKIDHLFDLRIT